MGLKNPVQLRQYRALLNLPDDIWQAGDDLSPTEGEIRQLVKQRKHTVTGVTVSKPLTLKLKAEIAEKWQTVRQTAPEANDEELFAQVLEFWLTNHQG